MRDSVTQLSDGAAALGVTLDTLQLDKLAAYCELIRKWNRAFNLVSRKDIDRLESRHVLDALSVHEYLQGGRVLDVGSGAGLPGVPLAISMPQRRFCLLDRADRRVRFLKQVKLELELSNVEVVGADVRTLTTATRYDVILARAVATVSDLWDMVAPLLNRQGRLLVFGSTQGTPGEGMQALPPEASLEVRTAQIPGMPRRTRSTR